MENAEPGSARPVKASASITISSRGGPEATSSVKPVETLASPSLAVIVTSNEPARAGAPESAPVAGSIVTPSGSPSAR